MPQLITADLVALDADLGAAKEEVIRSLARRVATAGRSGDPDGLLADAMAREAQSATGLPGGIAIPHCRSEHVTEASLAFARLRPRVDFGAPDAPADLVFLIAAPAGGGAEHLTLLASLARALVRPDFTAALRAAATPADVVALVGDVVQPAPAAAPAGARAAGATPAGAAGATAGSTAGPTAAAAAAGGATAGAATASAAATAVATTPAGTQDGRPTGAVAGTATVPAQGRRIVAVTACPTGIAHTYMAADSLVAAGERAGVTVTVETQGSAGSTPLPPDTISGADAVIFATDVGVRDRTRFAGKPVVSSGVKRAINDPDGMVREALRAADDPASTRVEGAVSTPGGTAAAGGAAGGAASQVGFGTRLRQWLLTGVSYMIPFVAAGGLLIALGFLFGGYDIALAGEDGVSAADRIVGENSLTNLPAGGLLEYLGAVLFSLGALAFGFLVPALAGYISYAIADRPGIAPGFAAGAVANAVGAGFIGGLVGGLIAGAAALAISRISVPRWGRGLMPVVIIPLFATLIAGGLMFLVLGRPLAAATTGLGNWLSGLSGTSSVVLGIVIGLMMAFDMGGPVNKAAYAFGAAGLSAATAANEGPLVIMATVMAAGMVPPLALALAVALRPKTFSPAERENGRTNWLLGASFITEGAIPFAAADPLRVIPSIMVGSAVTGAVVAASGVTLRAPHGGIFVLFAIDGVLVFLLALVAGTVVGALAVLVTKRLGRRTAELDA
ncbi:fructose-specific PTS transporter subunit EIIC [Quadrisphaera sp. DSM 44207]|uniref:PTS fructose transporter subunit IIABC n=1 Tax=Quadrisphaera sp. DSM 44207 TaxID=1881057 RepID=UPI0008811A69|nr:fructose-specific PTS transporter subunit EIIC [Quadrisphaera sp. DSM 44207]SDQ19071.1 PTS system D-fructose-specific IIA component (F1P-forming), Frc family /PTS system D-fructose-specific IIB component (F1P-forming), Frc family /PTS system D-fructose-specific IIC component (F1P-forming), Frc family [Quadrisphaera sp. DSM 44207]